MTFTSWRPDGLALRAFSPRREAEDGEQVAADPTRSDHTRACAARAAEIARGHAAEYREIADALRAGEIPENLDLS
ncbi:hypothetical protein ACIBL8_47270 [Streptomyces sp. NPDC050523]|uniref:hypothetical protein n=1 Tax=Streptomyces sp. NPDC050523 TaxID=3365622 RepID=UPI0037AB11D2